MRRFGTKSGGAVKLIYVYKVKQRNSAVYYGYFYNAIGCNLSLMCLQHGMVWFSMRYVTVAKSDSAIKSGTNLILTVRVSSLESCLQDVTQDNASSLQLPFDKVFLKLVALNKFLLFPIYVKKQCLFCVIVSTFDKLYSGW